MRVILLFLFACSPAFFSASAQGNAAYLKANAVRIDDPYQLSDAVYHLFSPFQIFMVGEMHGSNECAQFVTGLSKLLANKGDSISVGLEIPPELMTNYEASKTDSGIYQSQFFSTYEPLDGRESFAWANVISHLKNNKRIEIFFFDRDADEGKIYERDSTMYLKIKKQILLHPQWKVITLSGNVHANATIDEKKAASFLRQDAALNLSTKLCTICNYYQQGSCNGNFGGAFQEKKFDRPLNDWDTALEFDKYIILTSAKSSFPYTAVYYTKHISPSPMVKGNLDLPAIKKELKAIFDRDQKTRTGADSAEFRSYFDSCNQVQVKLLIAKYGWMGRSMIGNYNQVLFLVIQHADSATQEQYFPLLQQSVEEGESSAGEMAMMQDRIFMRRGQKQIYGSQVIFNKQGGQEFYPIQDEKNVNARRLKVGLPPIEDYAKYFGIDYKLPAK